MGVAGLTRYDLSLVGIAVPLVAGAVAGALSPVGLSVALGVGCVLALGSLGYALFYRPPDGSQG